MVRYYISPSLEAYLISEEKGEVNPKYIKQVGKNESYTRCNYLNSGITPALKIRHFETALKLTRKYFHNCNVIDFGCADGTFLPSLAKYFNKVVGIDIEIANIKVASRLIKTQNLDNVKLICNNNQKIEDLKSNLADEKYHVLYLLETLEHISDGNYIYKTKINFLNELSTLIEDDGIIIISVPIMVGIEYLLQYIFSEAFGVAKDNISKKELFKACFLRDTTDLEKKYNGGHIGFNHEKMELYLKNDFSILKKKNILIQVLYVLRKIKHNSMS